jgi:hypothetical protein
VKRPPAKHFLVGGGGGQFTDMHIISKMKNGAFWDVTPCGNIPEDTILHSHRDENLRS